MDKLPYADWLDEGKDLTPGEQIHINHTNCPAGEDTRRRLYIKRTDDGKLLGYCHNCGNSASYSEAYARAKQAQKMGSHARGGSAKRGAVCGANGYRLPADCTTTQSEWPPAARAWVTRYGIPESLCEKYGLGYSEENQRVILPIYRDKELKGYQTRRVEAHDDGPKYMTYANEKPLFWTSQTTIIGQPLVIVEDILSGIKVSQLVPAAALLTATTHDAVVKWISKQQVTEFIVFLDNDNRQVQLSQLVLRNRLSMFCPARIIRADRDPKEHSLSELKELLA